MPTVFIGIGGLAVSKTPGDVIKTMALGSCVGVVMLEPRSRSVGMAHIALPESKIDLERARKTPGHFADTGVPALIQAMLQCSGQVKPRALVVKVAGGAAVMDANGTFNIGKRNLLAVKKSLWRHGLAAVAEDVGGNASRTVYVGVDDGRVHILAGGTELSQL